MTTRHTGTGDDRSERVDSQRTAAAAQAYAEAMLIRRGVWTHRPILLNQEGFDLVCTSRERPGHLVRVQIKGRWATDSGTPSIRSERLKDFDYLILVRLNAGHYYGRAGKPGGVRPPELFVFPQRIVSRYFRKESQPGRRGYGGRFHYRRVPRLGAYHDDQGLDLLAAELHVSELQAQARRIVTSRKALAGE